MLEISRQARQFLGIKTSTIWIRLDNSVVSEVSVVVSAVVSVVVLVAFVALVALLALLALLALVVSVALVALVAAVVVVVAVVAVVNSSSFLKRTVVPRRGGGPCMSRCRGFF